MHNEIAAHGQVLRADILQSIVILVGRSPARLEDPGGDMRAAHGLRVGLGELRAQCQQATDVIPVIVRQHHIFDVREVHVQRPGIAQHQIG